MKQPFFSIDTNDCFVGNDGARGPWSADACHAGPVTGLLVRALEREIPDKQLVRVTASYLRPIPMAGFHIETETTRSGRSTTAAAARLTDTDGRTCATAFSLHFECSEFDELATAFIPPPDLRGAVPGQFVDESSHHDRPFFRDAIEVSYPPGENSGPGPTTLWMRTPPLLPGEDPSPFQRICPLADCGNGTSRNADFNAVTFVNPDLTIILHRLPESEWLASSAISFWERTGIGLAQATLFDEKGSVGVASQTLLIKPLT